MKKLLISFIAIFLSLNVGATIPQSGISDLRKLDSNEIIELISGNKLSGVVSNGPREGPVVQTFFKNGKYETIFNDKTYKGVWKVKNKKYCSKNNSATNFSCSNWYIGNRDSGRFAFIISEGRIIHQYHEVISVDQASQEKSEGNIKKSKNKEVSDDKQKIILDTNLNLLKSYLEKLQDLRSDSYKVEADKLINEIENNTDHTEYDLKILVDRVLDLNSSLRSAIKTAGTREFQRIADAKKVEEKRIAEIKIINDYINKLKNYSEKIKYLEFDSLNIEIDNRISEVENNINSDLSVLTSFKNKLNYLIHRLKIK